MTAPTAWRFGARPVALRRVFENLLDNALRYGEEAGVTLRQADGRAEGADRRPRARAFRNR